MLFCILPMCNHLRLWVCIACLRRSINFRLLLNYCICLYTNTKNGIYSQTLTTLQFVRFKNINFSSFAWKSLYQLDKYEILLTQQWRYIQCTSQHFNNLILFGGKPDTTITLPDYYSWINRWNASLPPHPPVSPSLYLSAHRYSWIRKSRCKF